LQVWRWCRGGGAEMVQSEQGQRRCRAGAEQVQSKRREGAEQAQLQRCRGSAELVVQRCRGAEWVLSEVQQM
jgi:hypothetical protein